MDTKEAGDHLKPGLAVPVSEHNIEGTPKALYVDAREALKAVRDDYLYWTGKLTDTSVQLSYAVLAANWAVFGSVDGILGNWWSRWSVLFIVVSLGLSVAGAKLMGERHLERIRHAETNPARWAQEFDETAGRQDPWPFSKSIESLGEKMRWAKTWLPIAAGIAFLLALFEPK